MNYYSTSTEMTATSDIVTRIYSAIDSVMDGKEIDIKNIDIKVLAKNYKKEKEKYEGARISSRYSHCLNLIIENI